MYVVCLTECLILSAVSLMLTVVTNKYELKTPLYEAVGPQGHIVPDLQS